jgi:hypothetical protein
MRRYILPSILSSLVLVLSLWSGAAHAQATRTWVSGVGDDANPCSRTAPCKTWAGAISKTAVGGEIDALDPGGFGALTITKGITLDGGGGQVASTLVAGTNGIVVQAGAGTVIIRNLRLDGLLGGNGTAGLNGIRYLNGASLYIENCDIFGFSGAGVDLENSGTGLAYITNTPTTHNGLAGVLAKPAAGGTLHVAVFGAKADLNAAGFIVDSTAGAGGNAATLTIWGSSANMNGVGVSANGGAATLVIGDSQITLNATGVSATGGAVTSNKNSQINQNTTDGTPVTAATGPLN